ncbi:WxL domain-containing protein [Geomicrobium sp. JCM 19039]|uniref:WxL domain-containing protein n=1 Tax=Geomicrobium sp. JCM 19039 TaxID=1460636 RepID=UPI00045F2248|nr:WxL domain-containing protein [Geomicrobium sp. JCM 19039]GAK14480.1 hypothetical protein JCM19039_4404 [Geomicrobium sp. JCM 19039]
MKKLCGLSVGLLLLSVTSGVLAEDSGSTDVDINITEALPAPGELTLDEVPSAFNFGERKQSSDGTYDLDVGAPVTVTDERYNGMGWQVKVQADPLRSSDRQTYILNASLDIHASEPTGEGTAPVNKNYTKVVFGGESQTLIKAAPGSGEGTWRSNIDRVSLNIPERDNSPRQLESRITWQLQSTPH